jgi:hypothetical protein
MSKIVPIFVCGVVASIFSFDVQAFQILLRRSKLGRLMSCW